METGRPVEVEGSRYENGPADITPSPWGAHNWQAMSYNPQTGLAYIPTHHQLVTFGDEGIDLENWQAREFSGGTGVRLEFPEEQPREYSSSLQAWDPVKQEVAWYLPQDGFWHAGTLTTAGNLVFQGRSDGILLAYEASTGDVLWEFDAGLGISAPPITYTLNGRQYISLLVGFGGGYSGFSPASELGWSYGVHTRRLISFSLDGSAAMAAQPQPYFPKPLVDPDFTINDEMAARGAILYGSCSSCHGGGALAGGMAPDLRASANVMNNSAFTSIMRDGFLAGKGMPGYPEITDGELEDLQHYIRKRALETSYSETASGTSNSSTEAGSH
jgi:quinohemoprotein ethanol dehydrogenase